MLSEDAIDGAMDGWHAPHSPGDMEEVISNSTRGANGSSGRSRGVGRRVSNRGTQRKVSGGAGGRRVSSQGKGRMSSTAPIPRSSKGRASTLPTIRAFTQTTGAGRIKSKPGVGSRSTSVASSRSGGRGVHRNGSVGKPSRSPSKKSRKGRISPGSTRKSKRSSLASSRATSARGSTGRKVRGKRAGVVGGKRRASPSPGRSLSARSKAGITKASKKATDVASKLHKVEAMMAALMERESEMRQILVVDEELEWEGYSPLYKVLVLELVRAHVQEMNARQKLLNETMDVLMRKGMPVDAADSEDSIIEKVRDKLRQDAVEELHQLRAENLLLRDTVAEQKTQLEKKSSEMEVIRNQISRQQAHSVVENEHRRAEVQAVLQRTSLNIENMKNNLGVRIDTACAAFRTPKYGSALRSLEELVGEVQKAIQDHHDTLSKLIVSIGAKDTFARDESGTMHTNLPSEYRADLRRLGKDHLLNLLDVLSFHEGVVDIVGKALYVLKGEEHQTSVV